MWLRWRRTPRPDSPASSGGLVGGGWPTWSRCYGRRTSWNRGGSSWPHSRKRRNGRRRDRCRVRTCALLPPRPAPTPLITVTVDPTNPGQFFACCGLLELAARLWPEAEGWFAESGREFRITCRGTLSELLQVFGCADVQSSLTDAGLARLGSLMSLAKTKLTKETADEKERLSAAWKQEVLHIGPPFRLLLDWWHDSEGKRTPLKTWAAKEFVVYKLRPLVRALRGFEKSGLSLAGVLSVEGDVDSVPFYFDSSTTSQSTARDVGFGLYDLRDVIRDAGGTCPATECLAFIGLQRCQPGSTADGEYSYAIWTTPVSPHVISAYVCGPLQYMCQNRYRFTLADRSDYMKAFSDSKPHSGDRS